MQCAEMDFSIPLKNYLYVGCHLFRTLSCWNLCPQWTSCPCILPLHLEAVSERVPAVMHIPVEIRLSCLIQYYSSGPMRNLFNERHRLSVTLKVTVLQEYGTNLCVSGEFRSCYAMIRNVHFGAQDPSTLPLRPGYPLTGTLLPHRSLTCCDRRSRYPDFPALDVFACPFLKMSNQNEDAGGAGSGR